MGSKLFNGLCLYLTGQATNTITWHFQNLQKINQKKNTAKQESRSHTEGVRPSTSGGTQAQGGDLNVAGDAAGIVTANRT